MTDHDEEDKPINPWRVFLGCVVALQGILVCALVLLMMGVNTVRSWPAFGGLELLCIVGFIACGIAADGGSFED